MSDELRAAADALADARNWVEHVVLAERYRAARDAAVDPPADESDDDPTSWGLTTLLRKADEIFGGTVRTDYVRAALAREAVPSGLPVVLASVDDVAAVCLAHGLSTLDEGRAWQTPQVLVMTDHDVVDGRLNSYCVYRSGNDEPMVAIQPHAPSAILVAAIEAARVESRQVTTTRVESPWTEQKQ